jgi:hypothetical protein
MTRFSWQDSRLLLTTVWCMSFGMLRNQQQQQQQCAAAAMGARSQQAAGA